MPTALLVTFGSFALILLLARIKVPLAAALLIGTAVLVFGFDRHDPRVVGDILLRGMIDPQTVGMVAIVMMLITLSELMSAGGQLQRIVALAGQCLRRPAVAMAAMPALIGLIPMPGGAIFSASMVETAAGRTGLTGAKLSAVNYWFRHIWEFWWPLYPAVILALTYVPLGMGAFAALQFPLTVAMLCAGFLLFRKTHPDLHVTAAPAPPGTAKKLLVATSSIWVIFVVWIPAQIAMGLIWGEPDSHKFPVLSAFTKFAPVAMGLIVTLVWTIRLNRLDRKAVGKVLTGGSVYMMALLVIGVMVFQYALKNVDAADGIAVDLRRWNVPVILVVAALPLIAGLVTGLGAGFVGSSFPIALPLAATVSGGGVAQAPYIVLAYACGHMGMMLSPMHLCQVVSNRYFKTGFLPVYRELLAPVIVTFVLEWAYFLLLRLFIP